MGQANATDQGSGHARPLDDFLSAGELGKLLKVGRSTIDRWRDRGLPCYRLGNRVWFREPEVAEFLGAKCREVRDGR